MTAAIHETLRHYHIDNPQIISTSDILCSIGWMVGKMHAHFAEAGSKRIYSRYAYDQAMVDRIRRKVDVLFAGKLLHYYMDIGSLYAHFTRPDEQALIRNCYEKITGRKLDPHFIAPFAAMQVLLFLISSYERIYQLDWFPAALDRWCDVHFKPLSS